MSATVVPLPPNSSSETTGFLRRMASMVSGRNGEMLLRAASLIESLSQRAMTAERLYHRAQEESTRNAERHEAAELDTLHASVDSFNETVVSVPIEVLRLARTQFDYLSSGFARKGDVTSQAMSEIGGFAIDQALTVKKTTGPA